MKIIFGIKLKKLSKIKDKHDFDKVMMNNEIIDLDKAMRHYSSQIDEIFSILGI